MDVSSVFSFFFNSLEFRNFGIVAEFRENSSKKLELTTEPVSLSVRQHPGHLHPAVQTLREPKQRHLECDAIRSEQFEN